MDAQANEARQRLACGVGGQDVQVGAAAGPADRRNSRCRPALMRPSVLHCKSFSVAPAGQIVDGVDHPARVPFPAFAFHPAFAESRASSRVAQVLKRVLGDRVVEEFDGLFRGELPNRFIHRSILSVESFSSRPRASGGFLFLNLRSWTATESNRGPGLCRAHMTYAISTGATCTARDAGPNSKRW